MNGRTQAVWQDNILSDVLTVDIGVPQGSLMGPLLFNIFVNDMFKSVTCKMDAYADDSTLTSCGSTAQIISSDLTTNCGSINVWMAQNQMVLNSDKTHLMVLGTSQKTRSMSNTRVSMANTTLTQKSTEKLLGCYIDQNLKWKSHICELKSKLKKRLACLSQLKYISKSSTRKMVANGVFNSVLSYCMPVWGGCDKEDLDSLQILQNRAAQLVVRLPPRTNRDILFN